MELEDLDTLDWQLAIALVHQSMYRSPRLQSPEHFSRFLPGGHGSHLSRHNSCFLFTLKSLLHGSVFLPQYSTHQIKKQKRKSQQLANPKPNPRTTGLHDEASPHASA